MSARICGLLLAWSLLLFATPAAAQQGDGARDPTEAAPRSASPLLPPDHWAVQAAMRADALGLTPRYLPAQRSVPRRVVGWALRQAFVRAQSDFPGLRPLAEGWLRRFVEEFPDEAARLSAGDADAWYWAGRGRAGYLHGTGRAAAGEGLFPPNRIGAVPLSDQGAAMGGVSATVAGRAASLLVESEVVSGEVDVPRWDLTALLGPVSVAVGRQTVGYGYGFGADGVVLSGSAPLDRVEVRTARPGRLPGLLRHLGPVSLHAFLSRFSGEARHPGDPFFWGASGQIRPHPRLVVGVHRAAFFGGDSVPTPVTPRSVVKMLVGVHGLDFENQIVSAGFRYRLPVEPLLPLTVYGEWGSEDSAGSFASVPGVRFGAFAPALPGAPAVSLGVERSSFGHSCCGNPPWYRHASHSGGWAAGDVPLGHALGGQGTESLLFGRAELFAARLRLEGRAFRRTRGEENLYAPERGGRSTGVGSQAEWRLTSNVEARISIFREEGDGWAENALRVQAVAFF